ncbi:hypothetical protein [Clostridium perfringens]|uniref:hypothetical protein n=1 Tax=Clostridium perfringens TaxID=1502 RepID=UPI00232CED04|nr:hypothetical protein [Clostridium perfringens]MDB2050198.1 hypothetical protein [Clostridium perfringens]
MINKYNPAFNVGDTVYCFDDDYTLFDCVVYRVEIQVCGMIEYTAYTCGFTDDDINQWVFKSEEDRANFMLMRIGE